MIKTVEKFCSEKRLRFGYGFEGGLNDFFSSDANGVYVIIGRPRVGVTEGDVVLRGNAVQYRDELAAMLGRNGNRVSRSDNRLHVVFRIARPMSSGGTGIQPEPTPTPSVTPLFIEAKVANSTVSMMSNMATSPSIEYSEDNTTWQTWPSTQQDMGGGTMGWIFDTITLTNVGDKVYFRGTNAALSDFANQKVSVFSLAGNLKLGGTVQSLVDGTGESTTAIEMAQLFPVLGQPASVITEVEEGLLPATTLVDYCYYGMFVGQAGLTSSPILPAKTIPASAYNSMFPNCSSLTTITCLATDISATNATLGWVSGVAASGTFYKDPSMNDWSEDNNGYPSGWTLTDYAG